MSRQGLHFLFLNVGHFLDHFFMLVFATMAALALSTEWGMSYAELIPYATPGFVAFGVFTLPMGWLADRWSRPGMIAVFFIGIGLAAAATALATTPLQMGLGLFAIGVFAAIYHPVGLALVVEGRQRTGMPLAVNGVFGNLGVAAAALITGVLIDSHGWRAAFVAPGLLTVALGLAYLRLFVGSAARAAGGKTGARPAAEITLDRQTLVRLFAIILFSTAVGGLIFQSTTFALPKIFDERLQGLAVSATAVGWYAFLVFSLAAVGQLIVGYLIDRFPVRLVFMAVAGLQALLFTAMPGLSGWPALAVAIAFMLVVFGQIPINDMLIGRFAKSEWRSRVYALRYIVTFSVMASSVPLIAWIHGTRGFDALFTTLAAAAACIFLAVALLPGRRLALATAQ